MMVETFTYMDYTTSGTPPPSFKQAAEAAKKVPTEVVIATLGVALSKEFVTKEVWAQATSAPRSAVQKCGARSGEAWSGGIRQCLGLCGGDQARQTDGGGAHSGAGR